MHEHHVIAPHKRTLLIILVIVMAILASLLTYKRNSRDTAIFSDQSAGSEEQVKGIEISATKDPYSSVEALKKMELTAENIIWFTNYYRVRNGLAPVKTSAILRRSAYLKTLDMFTYRYFDHARPTTSGNGVQIDLEYFVKMEGYDFLKIAENLAQGDFKNSREVVDAWMQSSAHRENILGPDFTQIGVSIQTGALGRKKTTLIAQHFGKPQSACPAIDQSVREQIDFLKGYLITVQKDIDTAYNAIGDGATSSGSAYEKSIEEYNAMVNSYNASVKKLADLVTVYNRQIKIFDQCAGD